MKKDFFSLPDMQELRKKIRKRQDSARFEHTLQVAYTAANLAVLYGEDPNKALLAGMLHDVAKCLPDEKKISYSKKGGYTISEVEKNFPQLLHGKAGAYLAAKDFGIEDEDILNAICYHTTGRPGMSLLEIIVFTADYMEPSRNHSPRLTEIRQLAFQDYQKALVVILQDTLRYLEEKGRTIDPMTQETFEYYAKKD